MEHLDQYGSAASADLHRRRVQTHLRALNPTNTQTKLFKENPFECLKTTELETLRKWNAGKIENKAAPEPSTRLRTFPSVAPGQTGTMTVE